MRGRTPSLAALATAVLAAVATAAVPSAGNAEPAPPQARATQLSGAGSDLERRSRAAVIELYALESALADARAARQFAERRVSAIAQERRRVAARRSFARRSHEIAQSRLAARLRALYQEAAVDPLEILLGAASLDDAFAALDDLGFAVEQDREIIAQTATAKRELERAARRLVARRAAAERARLAAVARTDELERAVAARHAYVQNLAEERRLRAAQIEKIEHQAAAAQTRAAVLSPAAAAPRNAPAQPPADAVAAPTPSPAAGARTLTVSATAYALPGRTATGLPVGWGIVAVDPSVIPLGTRMTIPGYGEGVAADVGPAIRGAEIDVWFPSVAQARAWGRRTVSITLH